MVNAVTKGGSPSMLVLSKLRAMLSGECPCCFSSLREYDSYRYIATVRYRIDGTVRTALRLCTTIQDLYKRIGSKFTLTLKTALTFLTCIR